MIYNYRPTRSLENYIYTGGPYTISSDGTFIVCGCKNDIKIIRTNTPELRRLCLNAVTPEFITALALNPMNNQEDQKLLSASRQQIQEWNLVTLEPTTLSWKCIEGHDVKSMTYDSSGEHVATAGADGKVLVWKVKNGSHKCICNFNHQGAVNTVIFHHAGPNQHMLYSGCDDGTITVWSLKCRNSISLGNGSAVDSLALSGDGMTLLSIGCDKVVKVWNLKDNKCKSLPTDSGISALCLVPPQPRGLGYWMQLSGWAKDNAPVYFITVGVAGVQAWIYSHERGVRQVDVGVSSTTRGFHSVMLLPSSDNNQLLCVTVDHKFLICELKPVRGNCKGPFDLNVTKTLLGYNDVSDIKFFSDSQFLAVSPNTGQVLVYDIASMSCDSVLSVAGHTDGVSCLDTCVTNDDTKLIVTGDKDMNVRLWEIRSKSLLGVGKGHVMPIRAIACSEQEKKFVVSGSSDGVLWLWKIDTYSLKGLKVARAHDQGEISSVAINRDESLVCSGSLKDHTARLWNLPDLTPGFVLEGHTKGISSVEFSPVRNIVLTASVDKTVRTWDAQTGCLMNTFEGHKEAITRATYISDNDAQFVSCGADGLKLWTVGNRSCIPINDDDHAKKVRALALSKREHVRALSIRNDMIATVGCDARINIWCEEERAMIEVVSAYLCRYPYRTYVVCFFFMPGLSEAGRLDVEWFKIWYIHGLWVRSGGGYGHNNVGLGAQEYPVPNMSEIMLENLKQKHIRSNINYEYGKHAANDGFTREEYFGCIRYIALGNLRLRIQKCFHWLIDNGTAKVHPSRKHGWYQTTIAEFQSALQHEFGFDFKFKVNIHLGEFFLVKVMPHLDSNLDIVPPGTGVSPRGVEMMRNREVDVSINRDTKFSFYFTTELDRL